MPDLSNMLQTTLGGYSLSRILSAILTLMICLFAVRLLMKLVKVLIRRLRQSRNLSM